MLKLIIFDMDGLMLDTERVNLKAFCDVCAVFGTASRPEVYMSTIGVDGDAERRIFSEAFPAIDGDEFCDAVHSRLEELLRHADKLVKPGLFELFDAIERKGGIKKAVVTANNEAVAIDMLTKNGIMPRLDGGVYREMVARSKPFPDSHLLCCEMFGVRPDEALVLEDSESGISAALAAGIPVIAIPDLLEPSPEMLGRCLARCNTLSDVIAYL